MEVLNSFFATTESTSQNPAVMEGSGDGFFDALLSHSDTVAVGDRSSMPGEEEIEAEGEEGLHGDGETLSLEKNLSADEMTLPDGEAAFRVSAGEEAYLTGTHGGTEEGGMEAPVESSGVMSGVADRGEVAVTGEMSAMDAPGGNNGTGEVADKVKLALDGEGRGVASITGTHRSVEEGGMEAPVESTGVMGGTAEREKEVAAFIPDEFEAPGESGGAAPSVPHIGVATLSDGGEGAVTGKISAMDAPGDTGEVADKAKVALNGEGRGEPSIAGVHGDTEGGGGKAVEGAGKAEGVAVPILREASLEMAEEEADLKNMKLSSAVGADDPAAYSSEDGNSKGQPDLFVKNVTTGTGQSERGGRGLFKVSHEAAMENKEGAERAGLARLSMNGRRGEVKMLLNLPSLGKLQVELSLDKSNLSAVFHTESQAVKSILEGNIGGLRDSLSGQDLQLESFDVLTGREGREKGDGEWSASSRWKGASSEDPPNSDKERPEQEKEESLYMKMEGLDVFA